MRFKSLLAVLAIVGAAAVSAQAATAPKLFADSQLVTEPRFSDEIIGHGPDVIFIPGLASSRETWKATAERLKDRFRVHLIQVAGFAGEPARANASGPVVVPTAEAIDAYLVAQHLTPAVIVGHSLGGTMVLYLAESHGADLKKGFIVDALPFYPRLIGGPKATPESMRPMADAIRSGKSQMTDAQAAQFMASMATAKSDQDIIAGWRRASDKTTVANALADDFTLDLGPGLADITVPLTLIYPDYVRLGTPPGTTDKIYRGAYAADTHMTFVRADNSLHFIMFDQPAQFAEALDAFLAD
ncbi:MAG: alpha/beta hydrolase [Alphaproteobacteria bacterium]|nr:alpha/beta hydrolase [Alphaproteobacteria bacterium]MDE2109546.1 alpha/beta hydrolase [Alphaproteobacteria bacterium]MDE2493331.1 alpha/beta hydrolase [Alphaproteobacteria bacterium]